MHLREVCSNGGLILNGGGSAKDVCWKGGSPDLVSPRGIVREQMSCELRAHLGNKGTETWNLSAETLKWLVSCRPGSKGITYPRRDLTT